MGKVVKEIRNIAEGVYKRITKKKAPSLEMPVRSLQNVSYDPKKGYFELKGKMLSRTLTASTIKTFAQSLLMMKESKNIIETDDIATKREMYYVSKNWGDAMFREQPESLSCEENVVVRINGKIKITPAKEIVDYAFKHGKIIKKEKKAFVEKLNLYSLSFNKNLQVKEHKIKYVHKHPPRELINIVSISGREVAVTPFHSVFTINNEGIIESKSASEINKEDFIAIPKKLELKINHRDINLIDSLKKINKNFYLYLDNVKSFDEMIKNLNQRALHKYIKNNYKHNVKTVLYQWRIHLSIPLELIKYSKNKKLQKDILIGFPSGKTKIKAKIKKDCHLGFILGLLLSEGANFIVSRNKNERQVRISNNSKKIMDEFIESFVATFGEESLNNKPKRDKNGNYILNIGYQLLSLILEEVFEYEAGTKSWDKKVPSLLFDSPDECVSGFIKSFWLGDGSINYDVYRLHSTSKQLIEGINLLLLRKGIFCKIYGCKRKKEHHHKPYEIKITNLESVKIFKKIVDGKELKREIKSTFSGDRIPNIGVAVNKVRKSCSRKLPHKVIKMLDWYTMGKKNQSVSCPTLKKILDIFVEYKPKSYYFNILQKYTRGDIYWDKVKELKLLPKPPYTMDFTVNPMQNFIGGRGLVLLHNSDTVMDDIEAMIRVNREQLGFVPEEKGGDVAGKLIVIDKDDSGKTIKIDCTKFGSGAYSVPTSVEELRFETNAKFVLAIETAGMFQRLVKHGYWKKANCILISMGGVPTRACRRFIRRLSDEKKIPVYVFTDSDPYGFLNIYRTLKVGSGNAAHINKYFCVPKAKFIGVTPQDIIDYKLPTHPLKEVDIKRIKDGIKNDPFVHQHKQWEKALRLMQKMGKRAEQQAFAKYNLNYVIDNYLPKKLKDSKSWLP